MSVVTLSMIFAVSVPIVFVFIVYTSNGYLRKRMVDVDDLANKTPNASLVLKRSGFQRIKEWVDEATKNLQLYNNIFLALFAGVIAYLIAAEINPALVESGTFSRVQVIRIVGPFIEEVLKALILIYFVYKDDHPIAVGVLFGFGVGIGFAMVENLEYIRPRPEIAFTVAYSRVFSTNLVHATCSGLIGAGIFYLKFYRTSKDYRLAALAVAFGIGLHMIFNTMVNSGIFLIVALAIGLLGGGSIIFITKRANLKFGSDAINYVNEETARASRNEARIIRTEADLRKVFNDIEKKYSTKHAILVDEFLKTQVEILAKRKVLKVETKPQEIKRLQGDIDELIARTDKIRQKLGWECMLHIRNEYSVDEKLWSNIHEKIAQASTGQKGGGVWDAMNARIKQSKSEETKNP